MSHETIEMKTLEQLRRAFADPEVQDTLRGLEVLLVYFHGSRARGRGRSDSDYDFAVLLDDRRSWTFLERVERLDKFGELMAKSLSTHRDAVDVQDLGDMPVSIAFNVVGDGVLLGEGEPRLGVCFKGQTYNRYLDFEWVESFFRGKLREKLLGERRIG